MWKNIAGFEVWIEDGIIIRGVIDGATVYPYKKHFDWRPDPYKGRVYTWTGGYDKVDALTVDAFRRGINADRIVMM